MGKTINASNTQIIVAPTAPIAVDVGRASGALDKCRRQSLGINGQLDFPLLHYFIDRLICVFAHTYTVYCPVANYNLRDSRRRLERMCAILTPAEYAP